MLDAAASQTKRVMVDRIREGLLSEQDKQVITKTGYDEKSALSWKSRGMGGNSMAFVIGMQRPTVDENAPILDAAGEYRTVMGNIAWGTTEYIDPFLDFAREQGLPVTHTRVTPPNYDDPDHPNLDIVDLVMPEGGDAVIDRSYVSAFYGTDLLSQFVHGGHDLVITVGSSTGGCVWATVVNAKQNGFSVVLPQECILDRIEASHRTDLLDLQMKHAKMLETETVKEWVETL